ncbi:hypothetical protein EDEG_02801 [Edhazardia aedis USNM 41457]|uniref:Uncharacterized protein n=1 Tax=Edhazardia aedis (strain USNM 41457) TaxID=1003232 RepID=J9DJK8_EDHAE|nr:hypothetical protein EDEG_02801 [Edhazardia aedis USNM 41457]|eukprot:EJW02805.1 hypothetical protein EDEG_02801 [Edhazardia aedis USNM 41457]
MLPKFLFFWFVNIYSNSDFTENKMCENSNMTGEYKSDSSFENHFVHNKYDIQIKENSGSIHTTSSVASEPNDHYYKKHDETSNKSFLHSQHEKMADSTKQKSCMDYTTKSTPHLNYANLSQQTENPRKYTHSRISNKNFSVNPYNIPLRRSFSHMSNQSPSSVCEPSESQCSKPNPQPINTREGASSCISNAHSSDAFGNSSLSENFPQKQRINETTVTSTQSPNSTTCVTERTPSTSSNNQKSFSDDSNVTSSNEISISSSNRNINLASAQESLSGSSHSKSIFDSDKYTSSNIDSTTNRSPIAFKDSSNAPQQSKSAYKANFPYMTPPTSDSSSYSDS